MRAHDVLFCGLGVFESDDFVVLLLALKTANPLLPVSLLRPRTKLQLGCFVHEGAHKRPALVGFPASLASQPSKERKKQNYSVSFTSNYADFFRWSLTITRASTDTHGAV